MTTTLTFNGHTYPAISATYVDGVMTGYGWNTQWYALLNDAATDISGYATAAAGSVAAAAAQAVIATAQAGNAAASATAAASVPIATATDSNSIAAGSKTFTVGTGKAFIANEFVIAANSATNYLVGQVTSYTGGVLTISVPATGVFGSGGPYTSWNVGLSGPIGPTGATGATGATGSVSSASGLILNGSASGTVTFVVPAAAGSNTITFPAGTTNFSTTGGTSQVVKQTSAGGAFTVGQLAASDLSNGVTGSGAVLLAAGANLTGAINETAATIASAATVTLVGRRV